MFSSSPVFERSSSFGPYILSRGENTVRAMAAEQLSGARRRTFTRWLNLHLQGSKIDVKNLENDLASGVVLVRLLQSLTSQKKVIEK